MNTDTWTVIATKPADSNSAAIHWRYEPGYTARNVMVAVDSKRLIVAHKRVESGWHLVAKLAKS